ncbi:MAG: laccase domain-containing protein [Phycisphaerales bacterium]|nr:laccase domain-containing protein [Phycisphaerales bacterium]
MPHNPKSLSLNPGWESSRFVERRIAHWFSSRETPSALWIAQHLAGCDARPARVRQVHGGRCVLASACMGETLLEADAIISNDPLTVPMVSTADCVPVLVVCTASRSCAAIHAGWRGIAANIVQNTITAMKNSFGALPESMIVAIGPCAGRDRYEVGEEVIKAWSALGLSSALHSLHAPAKAMADCAAAVRMQFEVCGIPPDSIDDNPPCTISDLRFVSHRREPENKLRMLAAIAAPM